MMFKTHLWPGNGLIVTIQSRWC